MSADDSKGYRRYTYCNPCERCQKDFSTHRKSARFCGLLCSSAWNSERVKDTRKRCTCEWCGVDFRLNPKSKRAGRFCTRECSFSHKGRIKAEKEALVRIREAWKVDAAPKPKKTNLSRKKLIAHLAWLVKQAQRGRVSYNKCPVCQCDTTVTIGRISTQRCASCQRSITPTNPESRRKSKATRKARLRGASVAESIDPKSILHHYRWTCYLCGVSTPQHLRGTYQPNAPEVDHVIPLSKGGLHVRSNLACACRSCNGKKSDLTLSEFFERRRSEG